MEGWCVTDLRLPIGRHNGSPNALYWAKLNPGDVQHKHRHERCEKVYYVIRGNGMAGAGADRVALRAGHFHFIPRGVEHFLSNASVSEPLEVLGVMTGAGSIEESGYVFMGEVTPADLRV